MAVATQAQGSRSIPRPHSHHEPDDPYDQWLLTFPAASPSKMSREKTRDQIGNSIENVPEIVSATVHQIIRAIVGVTVRRSSPQGSGAESLGIVENIDGDEEGLGNVAFLERRNSIRKDHRNIGGAALIRSKPVFEALCR